MQCCILSGAASVRGLSWEWPPSGVERGWFWQVCGVCLVSLLQRERETERGRERESLTDVWQRQRQRTLTLFACVPVPRINSWLQPLATASFPAPLYSVPLLPLPFLCFPQPLCTFIAVALGGNCNKLKRILVLEFESQLKLVSLGRGWDAASTTCLAPAPPSALVGSYGHPLYLPLCALLCAVLSALCVVDYC